MMNKQTDRPDSEELPTYSPLIFPIFSMPRWTNRNETPSNTTKNIDRVEHISLIITVTIQLHKYIRVYITVFGLSTT